MARPTDTERGARIALAISVMKLEQPDLFMDVPDLEFWQSIFDAAALELLSAKHLRDALASALASPAHLELEAFA